MLAETALDLAGEAGLANLLCAGDDSGPHQADNVGLEIFEVYVTFTVSRR